MRRISIDAAQRIALGAQGFGDPLPTGRVDVRHFRRVMNRIGLVQLDSVNVCVRSHYMPFYSRLGPYDQSALDTWLNSSGEHFEYWAHEAAVVPIDRYPLWRWKMAEMKPWRRAEALLEAHPEILDDVMRQVVEHGPLTVRDLDVPATRTESWWGYGPGKVALEVLFANGHLTALRTGNFVRLYDIPHRSLPEAVLTTPEMPEEEAYRELLTAATRHHGIGTVHDIADYFRLNIPKARPIIESLAREGRIVEVKVDGWKGPIYMDPAAVRPRSIVTTTLLSPFDPVVWYRERAERLFDFRYRIEIYVPEPERVHGYYVLPLMVEGLLVGRVDLKADRKNAVLEVRSAFREEGTDQDRVAVALAGELQRFAGWIGLKDIEIGSRGNLIDDLRRRM
ncbi:MAG: winged helix DNA-binding domain-containing protein [Acidimicrobiia bacterium]|nr:winged helix DNA-binding domain-containing protein [Acidimicrobiia bacterium]